MKIIYLLSMFVLFQLFASGQTDSLRSEVRVGIRGKWQTGNFAQFVVNPNIRLFSSKEQRSIRV